MKLSLFLIAFNFSDKDKVYLSVPINDEEYKLFPLSEAKAYSECFVIGMYARKSALVLVLR